MTDEAVYQPFPTPHGRMRPIPPSLRVQQGSLPPELVEQARASHAEAEVLILPRAVEAYQQHGGPNAPAYLDFDLGAVMTLQRAGASVDFLAEDHRLIAEFSRSVWIDFAVAVAATVSAETVIAIARYLAGRVRRTRQSGDQPQLDLVLARPDGTFLRAIGTDTEAVLKAYFANLATVAADPATRAVLLRLATDPFTHRRHLRPTRLTSNRAARFETVTHLRVLAGRRKAKPDRSEREQACSTMQSDCR